ncbi:MAG: hypothetical protein V1767_00720 [Chloroflexota bacterium]
MDFFNNSIMLYIVENGLITAMHVSPDDVASSLLSVTQLSTGLLPLNTLWYIRKELETEIAIYYPPHIRKLAIVTEALKPPERFTLPLPGLIFLCVSKRAPKVWAVKGRPASMESELFAAPFPNTYQDARTCAGTQAYNEDVSKIPEEFFMSFFSLSVFNKPSKSHPDSLYALWKELNGKKEWPMDDLQHWGQIKEVM